MSAGVLALLASLGAASTPPIDPSVLRVIGDNGVSTTFIDRSPSAATLTTVGVGPVNSVTVVGTGAHSMFLPGSGTYVTAPDSPNWNVDGVATWEALLNIPTFPGAGSYYTLLAQSGTDGTSVHVLVIITDSTTDARVYWLDRNAAGTQLLLVGPTIHAGADNHVAVCLTGATHLSQIFANGAASSSGAGIASTDCDGLLQIGAWSAGGSYFAGRDFIGNLKVRITPLALYSGAYTPPTDFGP